jgi:ADP-ribosyl-[dinitrogen reductase] hydrolase
MSYCSLENFEQFVMKEDKNNNIFYILSPDFGSISNKGTILSHLSIFDIEERGTIKHDKEKVDALLQILINSKYRDEKLKKLKDINLTDLEKRAIGSMLGMAIGDALGSTYEFRPVVYKQIDLFDMDRQREGRFKLEPGQWTDDTSMGLCLADSLLVNDGKLDLHDLMHRFLAWAKGGYNNAFRFNEDYGLKPSCSIGLGNNIKMALKDYSKKRKGETTSGDKNTSGNGSLMRNAAIPICFYYDSNLACEMAKKQSLSTHQGIEAKECCNLLTYIIIKIFEGRDLKRILDTLGDDFKCENESVNCLAKSVPYKKENWNWKDKNFRYNNERTKQDPGYIGSYAMDNLSMSLHIIYYSDSFKESIIKAANLRGDSDSVASVVGQIAGAYYPIEDIPSDWIKNIRKWDNGEIALRGYMLARLHSNKSFYNKK